MDKKEIESLIKEKEGLYKVLNGYRDELIEKKSAVRYDAEDLWLNTIWGEVITNGKVTDKTKEAYVNSKLRESKEELERTENLIKGTKQQIEIINDKLMYLGECDD